jgi:hypothetical protein
MKMTKKEQKELNDLIEIDLVDIKIFLDLILERQADLLHDGKINDLDTDSIRWLILAKKSVNNLEELLEVLKNE